MSQHNGDKARFQKNRKRAVLRRAKAREMAAGAAGAEPRPAHGKPRRAPKS